MRTMAAGVSLAAAAVAGLAACSSGPTACPDVVSVVLMPRDTSVQVGQQFQAKLAFGGGCSRTGLSRATWSSSNPSVLAVDATTGLVTALAAGNAKVSATKRDAELGSVGFGSIAVRVTPAAVTP